ncbi:MAG TPA: transcription antitermination factor NusB [Terriglobia bacterium]|jgi:N utilization substance protein B|nr:transcription antitermination factor NusB [Terriglobia bacterium]
MGSRTKSRELALQMLFQWEVGKHPPAYVEQTFMHGRKLAPDVDAFARALFEGTVGEVASLDGTIAAHTQHWRMERMSAIDRNILRMALYEMLHYPETPGIVVINEAIELARKFSGEDSVEFVNGVLDAVWKSLLKVQPKV